MSLVLLSCSVNNSSCKNVTDTKINETSVDSIQCDFAEGLSLYINDISKSPEKYLKAEDPCNLTLIDSIAAVLTRNGNDSIYYAALFAAANISDGATSEHMVTVYKELIFSDCHGFFVHFFSLDPRLKETPKLFLQSAMCIFISDSQNHELAKMELLSKIENSFDKGDRHKQMSIDFVNNLDYSICD